MIIVIIAMALAQIFDSYWVLLLVVPGLVFLLISFFFFFWAPFIPSSKSRTKTMISLAKIKQGDRVYDLGAGDGKIVDASAQKGAEAIGFEISVPLVLYYYIKRTLRLSKGQIVWGNFFKKDISNADIVFCFLSTRAMNELAHTTFKKLKSGTRIVSNAFTLDNLIPIAQENGVYLYVIK